jgi:hypothetical protein
MLPQAELSFPRTRESRRGEADGWTAWMPASAGMTNSEESLRPQRMMLAKHGAKPARRHWQGSGGYLFCRVLSHRG